MRRRSLPDGGCPAGIQLGCRLFPAVALVLAALQIFILKPALAATYTVTTTIDHVPNGTNGRVPGTLREAIMSANTNANLDTIVFSPALTGGTRPARINLLEPLPEVVHPIVLEAVDGDPLSRKTPTVEITPAAGPLLADGLRVRNNSVIRGVALFGFAAQLHLVGQSNLVDSCNFGCAADGAPGAFLEGAAGVVVAGSFNRVVNCVAAGNGGDGIVLETATHCEILGNFVGLVPGQLPLGNAGAGISLDSSPTNVIGRAPFQGNIIGGNAKGGILLGSRFPDFKTQATIIEGNIIGRFSSDLPGRRGGVPGNGSHGITIHQQRQITVRQNEILGNHGHGIFLSGSSVRNTVIEGNFSEENAGSGISIFLGSQNVVADNEFSFNEGSGIQLESSSANQITGNHAERNRQAGIRVAGPDNAFAQASANTLVSNWIVGNGGPGIVQLGNANQNSFYANGICENGGLGIDLGGSNEWAAVFSRRYEVPFTNAFSRGDGPGYMGSLQNNPYQRGVVLTNAVLSNSVVRAGGHFILGASDSLVSGGLYHLQFYASTYGHPSGYGEGARTVGSFLIGPIPSFNPATNFSAIFTNDSLVIGDVLTATVTRTNNTLAARQTSEFSNTAPLLAPPLPAANRPPVARGDSAVTLEDQAVEFPVKANDSDPDGDPVTVERVWIDAPGLGFGPPLGTASLQANQTVRFVPAKDINSLRLPGPVRVAYVINDGRGLKANGVAAIQILPVNDPPQAGPDLATTRTDAAVIVKVLTNDTDPDGDPLVVIATTPASHGSVGINGGKTITYTPAPGYSGTDIFTYDISDGAGGVDTAGVTVLVQDKSTGTDLAVLQTVDPSVTATNLPVTFHLAVTNAGPLSASGVVLLVNLSGNAAEPAVTSSQGSFTNISGQVRFDLGILAAGSSASAAIGVSSRGAGSLVSSATVQSQAGDAFPQNDHMTATAVVQDGAEPSLEIADHGDHIRLSWEAAAENFRPEYRRGADDLAPWRRIAGLPATQGDKIVLDISRTSLVGEGQFLFRLVKQ